MRHIPRWDTTVEISPYVKLDGSEIKGYAAGDMQLICSADSWRKRTHGVEMRNLRYR